MRKSGTGHDVSGACYGEFWTAANDPQRPLDKIYEHSQVEGMKPTIIPTLRYHDAQSAIKWLCNAFGFKEHLVVLGDDGRIEHAQLTFGNGMIMLGSARDDDFGRLQAPPGSSDAVVCQSPYIIVRAIDEHYRDAVKAGAKIVMPLTAEEYGGKNYSCRDPEGYLWNFGSYDPWAAT